MMRYDLLNNLTPFNQSNDQVPAQTRGWSVREGHADETGCLFFLKNFGRSERVMLMKLGAFFSLQILMFSSVIEIIFM